MRHTRTSTIRRAVTLGVALALSGALLSAGFAAAGPVSKTLHNSCRFEHGSTGLPTTVSATFPARATVGAPVTAGELSVAVVLPEQLVGTLRAGHAATVDGSVDAQLTVHNGQRGNGVALPRMNIARTTIPDSGQLTLRATGPIPEVLAHQPGTATIRLRGAVPALNVHAVRDNAVHTDEVRCTPGQTVDSTLATVPVTAPAGAPDEPGRAPTQPGEPVTAAAGFKASHWVDGVSRIKKLGSEIKVGRGRFDSVTGIGQPPVPITGTQTLPPANGYFVAFRFMPTTSKVEFIQDGEAKGQGAIKIVDGGAEADVDVTVKMFVKLRDVTVNGTALNVGTRCQTAQPATFRIKGKLRLTNDPSQAPPVKVHTVYDIPRFAGCGATENLDPLISGMVSGPGNTLDLTLTLRCFRDQNCPPE